MTGLAGAIEDQFSYCSSVQYWLGLRWAAQAGDAAGGCRERFAGDAALAAEARLTKCYR